MGIIVSIQADRAYGNTLGHLRVTVCWVGACWLAFASGFIPIGTWGTSSNTIQGAIINKRAFWTWEDTPPGDGISVVGGWASSNTDTNSTGIIGIVTTAAINETSSGVGISKGVIGALLDAHVIGIIWKVFDWTGGTTSSSFALPIGGRAIVVIGASDCATGLGSVHVVGVDGTSHHTISSYMIGIGATNTIYIL